MNPNRNLEFDDCRQAYNDYHFFIKNYFAIYIMGRSRKQLEQGLLIDIHGQSHAEGWTELGYLLSANDLDTQIFADESSIRQMTSLSSYSFEDL